MNINTLKVAGVAAVMFITLFILFQFGMQTHAAISTDTTAPSNVYRVYDLLASTTAETTVSTSTNATSTNIVAYNDSSGRRVDGTADLRGAVKVVFYFSRAGDTANTGSTLFKVQTTRDGTNWDDFGRLVQATSTSVSATAMQSSANIAAATTTLNYGMDLTNESYMAARCIVVRTTDGSASCAAAVTY